MADVDLVMTAATAPSAVTLDDLRDRLRQDLHDEDAAAYRWVDDVLDRHISRAVRELSFNWPYEQRTQLSTAAGSREVDIDSLLPTLVRIEAVEYPTEQWPPEYVAFSLFASVMTLLVDEEPDAVADVNVFWGGVHVVDGFGSTLPPAAEDVVLTGAAAYAALELASFASNRANIAGEAAVREYQAWGELKLAEFKAQLAALGDKGRVRVASMYRAAEPGTVSQSRVPWQP